MKSNETKKRREQVLRASLNGISCFLSDYIKKNNALDYIYEGDVQADLYHSIKESLEPYKQEDWGEWSISTKPNVDTRTKTPCLVHCEQEYKGEKEKRIDIAIWDPTEENARKHYANKDLLLLIEIKYRCKAKWAIEEVKKDYEKLKGLQLKDYQKGLALTFTCDSYENFIKECAIQQKREIDISNIFEEKSIRAIVVCRDGIVEMQF